MTKKYLGCPGNIKKIQMYQIISLKLLSVTKSMTLYHREYKYSQNASNQEVFPNLHVLFNCIQQRLQNENEDMPKTQVYSIYCETDVVN